jgi:hypothetical protein
MLKSHIVLYSKVALLAIGVGLVIGIALCSPTTPTSSYVTITTALTPMAITNLKTGTVVHIAAIIIHAQYENQYVSAWVSITGPENFSGMMTTFEPGGPIISPGEPVPYLPPYFSTTLLPGAYTIYGTYEGMSYSDNIVISADTTTTVTFIFVGTPTTTGLLGTTTTSPPSTTTTTTEFNGPTYTSDLGGGSRLTVILPSSSVKIGGMFHMDVELTGPVAGIGWPWDAIGLRFILTNSSGENVYNMVIGWPRIVPIDENCPPPNAFYGDWSCPVNSMTEIPGTYSFFLGDPSLAWGVKGTIEIEPGSGSISTTPNPQGSTTTTYSYTTTTPALVS